MCLWLLDMHKFNGWYEIEMFNSKYFFIWFFFFSFFHFLYFIWTMLFAYETSKIICTVQRYIKHDRNNVTACFLFIFPLTITVKCWSQYLPFCWCWHCYFSLLFCCYLRKIPQNYHTPQIENCRRKFALCIRNEFFFSRIFGTELWFVLSPIFSNCKE